ncbi:hypothetical protein BN948_01774 [Hydrogenophaga intermedia]|uniref:Uncharacterized protein n=1 Tax=Hydrogenophaga intermedia TaxID=65786 RepID=A0A1L1PBF3_HYDIT|nr:hypothetical protein [Hydrogenophaga intermedia]CDN87352.1 hypothetical protein BN948_01774 [Hydrogenophaga intermedia]
MTELFWWQAALLFWIAVCFFRVGAATKGIAMTRRAWSEIAQAAIVVVVVFGLVTEGRGCQSLRAGSVDAGAACMGDAPC